MDIFEHILQDMITNSKMRAMPAQRTIPQSYPTDQGRIYHGANGAAAPGSHQFRKIRGPHHKDNEIDLFRIVDFLMWQFQATEE